MVPDVLGIPCISRACHRRRAAGRRWPGGLAPVYDARSCARSGNRRIFVLLLSDRTRLGTNPGRVARFRRQKPHAGHHEAGKNPRAHAADTRPTPVCQTTKTPISIAAVASGSGSGVGVIHARAAGQSLSGRALSASFWTAVASLTRHRFRTGGKLPDGVRFSCARKRRRRCALPAHAKACGASDGQGGQLTGRSF
jgi:hypothetical protein